MDLSIKLMRTTLTLDEDNVAKLRDEMERTGKSLKETVNTCLRRSFESPSEDDLEAPFKVEPRAMGARPGFDLDDIGGLLEVLDGVQHR